VNAAMFLQLSHFQAMLLFALIISIAFGMLGRRRPADRVKYALWCFVLFVLIGVAIGWAMYRFSH
jgi:accessory gene regulator protein AgrB